MTKMPCTPPTLRDGVVLNEAQANIDKTYRFLARLQREKFWGEITVKFKDGNPVLMAKREDILPDNLT